jgi:RHS repeat-associated protein
VKDRHDYLPFGEEIGLTGTANVSGRSSIGQQDYKVGDARQKFTGYERDNETELDYAQARYYSSTQGRFTSVDPLMASGSTGNPQSWNRYAYSYNNPLRFTDPTGLVPGDFYNLDGNKIGTDGKNDGKIYIVYDKDKAKEVKATQGNYKGTVDSAITISSVEVITAIGKAVTDSNNPTSDDPKGKFHEQGLEWKTVDGKTQISTFTGPYSPDPLNGAEVVISTNEATEGTAHVHPAGEVTITDKSQRNDSMGTTVYGGAGKPQQSSAFVQIPSPQDVSSASPTRTNIVVGARDKTVYFYGPENVNKTDCRCITKMSLNNFLKIGKQK